MSYILGMLALAAGLVGFAGTTTVFASIAQIGFFLLLLAAVLLVIAHFVRQSSN